MKRFLTLMGSVLFGCASLSLPGCNAGKSAGEFNATVEGNGNVVTGHGWTVSGNQITVGEGSARVVMNGITVTIKDGRISVDGKDRGPVQKGDSVVLKEDRQMYVNNEKR
jgi:hypothetical protein